MREKSRLDAVTGVVGDAAGALRRRRENRRPYVKLYAADGAMTVVDPASDTGEALLEVAASMVDASQPVEKSATSADAPDA